MFTYNHVFWIIFTDMCWTSEKDYSDFTIMDLVPFLQMTTNYLIDILEMSEEMFLTVKKFYWIRKED